MGRLILRLLGTPEVNHGEHPLTLQTRKVLELLLYLAVEQGIHSRDKITALLWPESDEERGKASLRRALSYLRESLDETAHDRFGHALPYPPHVLIEHHTLSFNGASDFEIDTQILQAALGDRTAALRTFERCRSILERELSVEPSSEIVVLAERIRSQASPVGEPVLHEVLLPRDALEFQFTGRAAEHRELVREFQTIRRGRTQVVTIEGEPGIGKTRLCWAMASPLISSVVWLISPTIKACLPLMNY